MHTQPVPHHTRHVARRAAAIALALAMALGMTLGMIPGSATGADAKPRPRVELTGTGTWSADQWITAVRAEVTGRPFDGTFTGGLRIDALLAPGTCIDAYMLSGLTRYDGRHDAGLLSEGELCGQHVQDGVSAITAVFVGEFDLYEGSRRDLHDTQGFVEVRFAADGRTSVTLVG